MAKSKKEATTEEHKPRVSPTLEQFLEALGNNITKTERNGTSIEYHVDYTALHNELKGKGFTATRNSVVQRVAKCNKRVRANGKKYKFVAHRERSRKVSTQDFLEAMDRMLEGLDK